MPLVGTHQADKPRLRAESEGFCSMQLQACPTHTSRARKLMHIRFPCPNSCLAMESQNTSKLLLLARWQPRHSLHVPTASPTSLTKPPSTHSTQRTLLYKTILSRLGEITIYPNSQEQTQKVRHNGEIEEYAPNEDTRKSPG